LFFPEQPQQDVLSADVAASEQPRLLGREDQCLSGALSEAFSLNCVATRLMGLCMACWGGSGICRIPTRTKILQKLGCLPGAKVANARDNRRWEC
jgi:hypothetical protein